MKFATSGAGRLLIQLKQAEILGISGHNKFSGRSANGLTIRLKQVSPRSRHLRKTACLFSSARP